MWDTRSEMVIEGFPRSGNTYFVEAFVTAQDRPVRIAHHSHSQSQVIRAVAHGTPTCVLIRHPADAVRSMLVRRPELTSSLVLRAYYQFYSDLDEYRDHLYLAPFERVITDLSSVVSGINKMFGADFADPDDSEQGRNAVFERVRAKTVVTKSGIEHGVSLPTQKKDSLKAEVDLDPGGLLVATEIYSKWMDWAQ